VRSVSKSSRMPVSIIPQENFTSFDDAIKFVESNPGRYVIKPSGEAQNCKGLLFVGEEEDGHDVLQVLGDYKTALAHRIKEFQRRIMGVEVAAGAFFNGKDFIYPICVNFEHKKLFPGDIGPSTGEMGTSMFWSEPNKIFNATLRRMTPKLREEGYIGFIDVNCIVNSNGIYPLEFTSRFGYPTISIQQEGLLTPISELLYKMAEGTLTRFRARSGFVSLQRSRDLRKQFEGFGDPVQDSGAGRPAHRRREERQRRVGRLRW
jgi:phosphoribosylamine---glycine ligase